MQIIALDAATYCGVAVGTSGGDPKCWSIDLGDGYSQDARFSNVLSLTQGLIVDHKPDLIVVEAAIGGKNKNDFLIGLVACIRGCAKNRAVRCETVSPATVRKHFIGKALTSADFPGMKPARAKIAIKERVMQQAKWMGWDVPDLDAADAVATWDWACANHVPSYQSKPQGGLYRE